MIQHEKINKQERKTSCILLKVGIGKKIIKKEKRKRCKEISLSNLARLICILIGR